MNKTIRLGSWVIAVDKIAAVVRNSDKEFTLYLVGIVQPFANSYGNSARCEKEYQMLMDAMNGKVTISGEELFRNIKDHGKEKEGI